MQLIKKNAKGYGYTYTDLAEITKLLHDNGLSYYQFIEPYEGNDYIMTVVIDADGKEYEPIRGAKVVEAKLSGKDNPVQAYGASLTYCRRYSLLMAFGLATTDDDAAGFTQNKFDNPKPPTEKDAHKTSTKEQAAEIKKLCKANGVDEDFIADSYMKTKVEDLSRIQAYTVINRFEDFRKKYVSGKA